MPIYKNNGVTYNIPDDKAAGFEAKFPGAMVALENEGVKYELPVSKKKGFMEKFPGATYSVAAPPAPKAEEINPTGDKSGYTFTAEELGMPDNTYKAESTSVAKLPEIKPMEVQNVKMDPEKLKLQGEALGDLNKEKEMLVAQLDEVRRKASERRKAIISNAGAYQFGMAPVTGNVTSEVADIEMAKLGATENQLEQAIREVDRKISGEDAGFWQGVLDATVRNPGFYTMGMSDMSDARAMLDLSENGINSETDLALADATYENSALQEEADRGFMYRAGNMFGHSIPFMVQMAASGGGTGISKLGGKAAQRFAKETLKHRILRATGVVADDLLESAFIANTAGAGTTQTNILQRKAGQLRKDAQDGYYFEGKNGWLEAAAKGEMSSILEQYTEKFGNHLDGKLSITKGLDKIGAKRISTALAAAKNSDIGKAANTVLTQFGINGVLPEVMEEEANLVLNSIFVGDNKLSDLFDLQTQLDIVGGMFLTVGTMRAIPGTIGSVGYIRNQRKLNAADKEAEAVYGEKWAEMRERLNNASNEEVADVCYSMIESGDDQALLDYYKRMMVMRGYNIGTTKREDNIPGAEQSYQEGYEAADEQKGAVKQAYDMERERALNIFGEEVVQKLDDDPIGALMELNEVDRQEAIAYVNARTAYEGMIDRISDDIDERIKASDKEIDSHKNRQDGAIHPAMMRGVNGAAPKRVYIVNGNVATLEDGTIDKANSSSMIIVRDAETGEVSAASADDLESLEAVIDTEAEKKSVADAIANQVATEKAAVIESGSVNGENGKLTYNSNDGVHTVEILGENGDVFTILDNGVERIATREWVDELKAQNGVVSPVEDQIGDNTEKVVEPVSEEVTPIAQAPKTALEQIPRNEKNVPLYEQVDSELAWDGVVEEAGGNEETAMVAVNSMVEDKKKALAAAEKAKAKAGVTIAEKIAAENERVANIERAKTDLAKWEEIAGVKTKRETAAVESAPVVEETQAPIVETPQATNEGVTEEHPSVAAANSGRDTVGGSPVALAYLLEGGQGSILNAGYFLHGVAAAFPAVGNEIEALRGSMSEDVLGMSPTDFAAQRTEEIAQIGEMITNAYGEAGAAIYNELLNNASGFVPRVGAEVGARIEALQPLNESTISQTSDQVAEGGNAPGNGGAAKGRRKPKGFRSSAKKSSEELFAEEKQKAVNGIYSGDYAKVLAESNSIEEAISQFDDMADAALAQAEEWASRQYKKNNTVVTGQNAQSAADEYETTIGAANERRREANIKRLKAEAETLRGYAKTLAERTGYSPSVGSQSGVPSNEEVGPFGRIYRQFKGKAKEAIQFLLGKKEGEAVGALSHPEIGDISLVWGNSKAGLEKIASKHPEVLDNLQEVINDMKVVSTSENRIKLESDTHFAVVSREYLGKPRDQWLLTAYEKKNSASDNTMDTGETSDGGKQNDTATLQNTVSTDEGTTQSANAQENAQKSGETAENGGENAVPEWLNKVPDDGRNFFVYVKFAGENKYQAIDLGKGETVDRLVRATMLQKEQLQALVDKLPSVLLEDAEFQIRDAKGNIYYNSGKVAAGNEVAKQEDKEVAVATEDELDIYLAEMKAAQERQKAFAQKTPPPSFFVKAYTENDAEVIKKLDKQFNDVLQTLVPMDIPAIEATIKGMKERKRLIKDNENPNYKAFDHIEKALAKRKKQLEKELTEDDKRRLDIIKRGNRGELKETPQPKQENKPVESEPIKDETPVTSETTEQPETGEVADAGPVNRETLRLNMSEEDFNALLNSGDKAAVSEYLAEMDGLLRIGAGSPLDGRDTIVKEYRGVVEQYGGEENIPADVVAGFDERIAPYNALQRAVFDRKYALQDKLREIEVSEAQAKEQAEKEAKAERKQTAFGGFLAGKTDVGASTAEKALSKKYNFDGKVMTVAEFVEEAVANGNAKLSTIEEPKYKGASRAAWNRMDARQQEADAKRVKESGTKTVYTVNDHDFGKTAYDYAKFLLDKKAEQEKASQGERSKGKTESESKQGVEKIEDVGEVLAGARKDALKVLASSFENATVKSLIELPFSKAFKKPDLKKAVESGALREEDALFYEAMFNALINSSKPKNSARHRNAVETWAEETYNSLQLIKSFVEADETARDSAMAEALEDKFPAREEELAVIEKRKVWNARNNAEWGDKTTPNPVWVAHEVLKALGYKPGDKVEIPFGVLKANVFATGYEFYNKKGERLIMQSVPTVEEGIENIVWLSKIKRGDADTMHPVSSFFATPTKRDMGDSGRYYVLWGTVRNPRSSEFGSKEEADAFAANHKESIVRPIQEVVKRYGYKIAFRNPLTGDKFYINDMEFETEGEAMQYLEDNYEAVNEQTNELLAKERGEAKKEVSADDLLEVAMVRGKEGWKYAVNIKGKYANNMGMPLLLREFDTREDAKAFLNESKNEVFEIYKKQQAEQKKFVFFDTGENSRIGEDYRGGRDVTAKDFMDTFGFRGVQFGNWTNQEDRQMAVNQAFDAFMDLAKLLGVSPKALSLNGELGMAFGSRGSGFGNAHYELGEIVINLTKTRGAGSLAHEWWHALDNYFARRANVPMGMVTDSRSIDMRPELRQAYNELLKMIEKSDFYKRSKAKGDYWGRMHEVTARLMAEWVDQSLKDRGELNTFLSRGVNEERYKRMNYDVHRAVALIKGKEALSYEEFEKTPEALAGFPYPSRAELKEFGDAMRNIFETVEEQETEEGDVVLYREGEDVAMRNSEIVNSVRNLLSLAKENTKGNEKRSIRQQFGEGGFGEKLQRVYTALERAGRKPTAGVKVRFGKYNMAKPPLAQTQQEEAFLEIIRMSTNREIETEILPALEDVAQNTIDDTEKADAQNFIILIERFKRRNERGYIIRDFLGADLDTEIPLDKIDELFIRYNSDNEVAEIYERVRAIAEEIGLTFSFSEKEFNKDNRLGVYSLYDNSVIFNAHFLYSSYLTPQEKASTIVHEMIHAVTLYAINGYENGMANLPVELKKAAKHIIDIYEKAVKNNPILVEEVRNYVTNKVKKVAEYGTTDVHEMIAEISNPAFRDKLKLIEYDGSNVWERLWDWIKSIFVRKNNEKVAVYNHLMSALDTFIEKFDKTAYADASGVPMPLTHKERYDLSREGDGPLTDREVVMESDPYSKVLGKPRYYGKRQREFVARQRRRMAEKARQVAEKLNLDNVEVLESTEGLTGKKATSKGWFDPRTGKITIVVPNHGSTGDIVETVLHEAVAHYGLRKLFGENFKNFLDNVYRNVTPEIRAEITELAKKHGWDFHTATEEYLASLAENTNFEKVNPSLWSNIKSFFMKMLAKVGITLDEPLGDNELRYILWRSHQNLVNPGWFNVFGQAEDIAKQYELGVGNYASGEVKTENGEVAAEDEIRFRKGQKDETMQQQYDRRVNGEANAWKEGWLDATRSVRVAQEAIEKELGVTIDDMSNVFDYMNTIPSINKNKMEVFEGKHQNPFLQLLSRVIGQTTQNGVVLDEKALERYANAKHGLERDREIAVKRALTTRENGKTVFNSAAYEDWREKRRAILANGKSWKEQQAELDALAQSYGAVLTDAAGLTAIFDSEKKMNYAQIVNEAMKFIEDVEGALQGNDALTPFWEAIKGINEYTLHEYFVGGLISKKQYDDLQDMYEYYVPLRGFSETTADERYDYVSEHKSVLNSAVKNAYGRQSEAATIFATMLNMANSAIVYSSKNKVKQRLLNLAMQYKTPLLSVDNAWYIQQGNDWAPKYPDIREGMSEAEIQAAYQNYEAEMKELEAAGKAMKYKEGLNINYKLAEQWQKSQHAVSVMRNGREYIVYVNGSPKLAQAINGLLLEESHGWLLNASDKINHMRAKLVTGWSPSFVARNLARDTQGSSVYYFAKYGFSAMRKYQKNIRRVLPKIHKFYTLYKGGKLDENYKMQRYFKEFLENGGETGYTEMISIKDYEKKIKKMLKENSVLSMAEGLPGEVADLVEFVNRGVENTCRFAAYVTSREAGVSVLQSIKDAKEASVNFNRKGSGARGNSEARKLYMFLNPAIRAAVQRIELTRKYPKRMAMVYATEFAMGAFAPMLFSLLYGLLGGDDDEAMGNYYNLTNFMRRSNICLPLGDGVVTIPLSHESRVFYSLGEMAMSYINGHTEYDNIGLDLVNTFAQVLPLNPVEGWAPGESVEAILANFAPDPVKPLVEIYVNSNFAGAKIHNATDFTEHLPSQYRGLSNTGIFYQKASSMISGEYEKNWADKALSSFITPSSLEHLAQSYLGGLYTFVDETVKTAQWIGGSEEYADFRNVPILNSFYKSLEKYESEPGERTRRDWEKAFQHYYDEVEADADSEKTMNTRVKAKDAGAEVALTEAMERGDLLRIDIFNDGYDVIKDLYTEMDAAKQAKDFALVDELDKKVYAQKKFIVERMEQLADDPLSGYDMLTMKEDTPYGRLETYADVRDAKVISDFKSDLKDIYDGYDTAENRTEYEKQYGAEMDLYEELYDITRDIGEYKSYEDFNEEDMLFIRQERAAAIGLIDEYLKSAAKVNL